jgi:hypothetical protein
MEDTSLKQNTTPVVKNNRPLTRKQAAFINYLVEHPKESATEAAMQTYNVEKRRTAEAIANENLRKPSIVSELSKYNNLVENTLINTINDWGQENNTRKREIAVDTAKYIHDKIHGKAKQSVDISSTSVNVNINLGAGENTPV